MPSEKRKPTPNVTYPPTVRIAFEDDFDGGKQVMVVRDFRQLGGDGSVVEFAEYELKRVRTVRIETLIEDVNATPTKRTR